MKCEHCGKNEAQVVVTVFLEGETVQQFRLCEACRAAQEAEGKLAAPMGKPQSVRDLVCHGCGLHFAEFCRTGHLGCPDCYLEFEAHLTALLRQTCGTDYFERDFSVKPEEGNGATLRDQLLELEHALQEAVREERYEMAAQIRDEVEMLRAALAAQ